MENTSTRNVELEEFLSAVTGETCWSVIAGAGTGSMFTMALGDKLRRARPIPNSCLSDDQRAFDGEFVVFIKNASWRIEQRGRTLCTSNDSNASGGAMLSGLMHLVENAISSARVTDGVGSLALTFADNICLIVSCTDENWENYSLHSPNHHATR